MKKVVQIYTSIENSRNLNMEPPKGYKYFVNINNRKNNFIKLLSLIKPLKKTYKIFVNITGIDIFYKIFFLPKQNSKADLIFSMSRIYEGKLPWVLHILETPSVLTGSNYKLFLKKLSKLENILSSDNCKKILCSNKEAFKLFEKYFSKKLINKIILSYDSPKIINFDRKKEKKKSKSINLLFIGSIVNPYDFLVKGGLDVLKVFEKLEKKYDIKLIMRCKIPKRFKDKIIKNSNITLIEETLSLEDLFKLHKISDLCIYPFHSYALGAFFNAMNFELPIVSLDTYAVSDYIENGVNGILVPKSKKISSYYTKDYPCNLRSKKFFNEMETIRDKKVIDGLYKAVGFLIENPDKRIKMGENGKELLSTKFSIKKRNKILKEIFDKATK
jgi:glycosyltransferase involved in cell wall biosynthesis